LEVEAEGAVEAAAAPRAGDYKDNFHEKIKAKGTSK
jgi:hypothetical protein